MRVLPVTNSGPTTTTTGWSHTVVTGLPGLQVMAPVRMPCARQVSSAPTT